MALQHLSTAPASDEFTPLEEHQTQTPSTFFGAKPVLHAHYTGLSLSMPSSKFSYNPAVARFATEADGEDVVAKNVEVWVNSRDLIFFQYQPTPTGLTIPYPSIALHATMKRDGVDALYMNLSLNDADQVNDDDEIEILELTVVPANAESATASIKDIYSALNACADLHPDPDASDEGGEDDMVEDTAPGAGGWITAENMGDFLDADGNFVGAGGSLGARAGSVRPREEDGEGANGINGTEDDTKWRRTE
ncbi:regulator of volume decrease after cellular swelling-domain-containing protein [Clohesyomyces aquaticus]|uniref:Regulator of volume decrease after cellular swelling-domain-containing protein n=1 Tax=Clohesyomyces aquaticus TaxID=1231657 RepID=A0A1Y1YHG3_9PLEO|nr:regulator of volume decrease after cellular swelling-domain-containing protein [Clohesyomyces aquaticus]